MRRFAWLLILGFLVSPASASGDLKPGWVEIDYAEIIDRREPTHSGEAVAGLLRRLEGRPMPHGPEVAQRPDDQLSHVLLDPVLEKYAFVMSDALDAVSPPSSQAPPLYELAGLWQPGEAEPAWVELLRARKYLVESDGTGRMRICIPAPDGVEAAWNDHWSVLRHVFRSEQARLAASRSGKSDGTPVLDVEIHPYQHLPARSVFRLGMKPVLRQITTIGPYEDRPSVDFEAWRSFLKEGRSLEGGRLDPDGSIRFLSSASGAPAEILGTPVSLADMAVAYRAIFHGGLGEPYMSLDRGYSPQTTRVNYGGRLRDTRLGMAALLCDIRFKTISVGFDIFEGRDVRERIRKQLPSFMTHVEKFAADPAARGVLSQQTRMWFYPDKVDMTLSSQGDVLVLRTVRMSAASERLNEAGLKDRGEAARPADPPWTTATVKVVNEGYDVLAGLFPELSDLDQVVRLLSFFTWLKIAEGDGLAVPDLDALLAVELPSYPTPRRFPQMLAFNALPPASAQQGAVDVFQRLEVGVGLDRLDMPAGRPLPAATRFDRATGWLDSRESDDRALQKQLEGLAKDSLDDASLDFYSYKAERIRMHRLVLRTLPREQGEQLIGRSKAGEQLRLFSVGIGGLDLSMKRVFRKAASRTVTFQSTGQGSRIADRNTISKRPPIRMPEPQPLPSRGLSRGYAVIEREPVEGGEKIAVILGVDSPDVRARILMLDATGVLFVRYENRRRIDYRMERFGNEIFVRRESAGTSAAATSGETPSSGRDGDIPVGTLVVDLGAASVTGLAVDAVNVPMIIRKTQSAPMAADFPRSLLQRLVLGPDVDPGRKDTIQGLWPPPEGLGSFDRFLLIQSPLQRERPWETVPWNLPGEEDAWTVAGSMMNWAERKESNDLQFPAVAIGANEDAATRWMESAGPGEGAILLMPEGALPGRAAGLSGAIRKAWKAGPVVSAVPEKNKPGLVVLVSAEPAGVLAARLRKLAVDPGMKGKSLVVWALGSDIRRDLPTSLLADGLGVFGLVQVPTVSWREVAVDLDRLSATLKEDSNTRFQDLPAPILWFY